MAKFCEMSIPHSPKVACLNVRNVCGTFGEVRLECSQYFEMCGERAANFLQLGRSFCWKAAKNYFMGLV